LFCQVLPHFFTNLNLTIQFGKVRRELRTYRPIRDFYKLQTELLSSKMGVSVIEADRMINSLIYNTWNKVMNGAKPYPGLEETIYTLKNRGLKLAVLSDFPVADKLKSLGLAGLWDYENSSENVGYLKPNPEPFMDIAHSFSVDPEEILYVGNSYELDIIGAKSAGMKTAYLTKKRRKYPHADIIFSGYSGFVALLEDVNFL
jgi:putative hydrolase of the HAD superfamily